METSHIKISIADKRAVINRFCELSNQEGDIRNSKKYSLHMKNLNELLQKFSLQDIIYTIEYLSANPPKKGLFSLRYLNYVTPDLIASREAKETLQKVEESVLRDLDVQSDIENTKRYNKTKKKAKYKGSVKFK